MRRMPFFSFVLGVGSLFGAVFVTAAAYGATFLLTEHFRSLGGNEIHTGWMLAGAAIGTLVGVPCAGWLAPRFGGARLAAGGSLAVGAGFLLLGSLGYISPLTTACGFLIGLGWGAFYLCAPLALSSVVPDQERIFWFMWLGAAQMLGIGLGPILVGLMRTALQVSTGTTFHLVAVSCLVAATCAALFHRLCPRHAGPAPASWGWIHAIVPLARTRALFPIVMVLLGACVFTSVLTFQTSIAQAAGFDPRTFFLVYTATVVIARFTLAPVASRSDPDGAAITLLIVMALGIAAAMAHNGSFFLYVASAVLLGIGYGLVYSVIQTRVVNEAPTEHRNAALTWFVLAYFVGVFGYPIVAGAVIVGFGVQAMLGTLLVLAMLELALAVWCWRAGWSTQAAKEST